MRVATRLHANGWLAVIEERADGDQLIGYALAPDGARHPTPEVRLPAYGVRPAYEARKTLAQQAVDQVVAAACQQCHACEPWRNSPS